MVPYLTQRGPYYSSPTITFPLDCDQQSINYPLNLRLFRSKPIIRNPESMPCERLPDDDFREHVMIYLQVVACSAFFLLVLE
ncbi:hypothetical protein C481_03502 [Natrialba asiatica DSM 12278]|uniref:Uncharacterized protein n=1 Tax=Natrialba asiatica (strain ATCC 700177 / DSM 12278 / JCM 9576 / FERM P-10747 / NBRC 102637 / 172P1) TaxID=29540 RepID=M0B416_NATA1|nr:hypothetical protein C481_03502 [Natrialba asiatica DSM 12278]